MSTPKIFIFCNGCSHEWHEATALSEDGEFLADHVCSSHGWIPHDMGIGSNWKHEAYKERYPDGYELLYVAGDVREHAGIKAAYELHIHKFSKATEGSELTASVKNGGV